MSKLERVIGADHHPEATTAGWDFWWRSPSGDVVAVFHGSGGGGGGQVLASWVRDAMTEPDAASLEARARWPIEQAHALALARVTPKGAAYGAMACVAIGAGRAAIAHVGNARVHAVSASGLELLTRAHTLANSRDPEHVSLCAANPGIDMLLRAVGVEDRFAVDVIERAWAPGEMLALSTPNVSKVLGDELHAWLTRGAKAPSDVVRHMQTHEPRLPAALAMVLPIGVSGEAAAPEPVRRAAPEPSGLPLYLVILDSSDRPLVGRDWAMSAFPEVVTIGRDPASTLEIRSLTVSRRHVRLERRAGGWHIVDDSSAGGTYVNDARVQDALLRHGDRIRIGDTTLMFTEVLVEHHIRSGAVDALTGLPSRRELMQHADGVMRGGARPLALVRIDVDRLKAINADRGHEEGNRVLAEMGARLRMALRPGEYAGRISADDFVVVLPGTDLRAASARAEELQAELSAIAPVSVGAAEVAPRHRDADEVIYDAEKDLFARRKLGST